MEAAPANVYAGHRGSLSPNDRSSVGVTNTTEPQRARSEDRRPDQRVGATAPSTDGLIIFSNAAPGGYRDSMPARVLSTHRPSGRRHRHARSWSAAVALAAALTLASCTTDADTSSTSPEPTASSPHSTPEPSPVRSEAPTRPEAMDRTDVEGAVAAAQYFLELYPYVYNTADLREWRAMSHPDCVFCASVAEDVEALHAEGGYEVGGEIEFESAAATKSSDGSDYVGVDVLVSQAEALEFTGDSAQVREVPAARYVVYTALAWTETGWMIREVTPERQP